MLLGRFSFWFVNPFSASSLCSYGDFPLRCNVVCHLISIKLFCDTYCQWKWAFVTWISLIVVLKHCVKFEVLSFQGQSRYNPCCYSANFTYGIIRVGHRKMVRGVGVCCRYWLQNHIITEITICLNSYYDLLLFFTENKLIIAVKLIFFPVC